MKDFFSSFGIVGLYFGILFLISFPFFWGIRELGGLEYELSLLNLAGFAIIFVLTLSSAWSTLEEGFGEHKKALPRFLFSLRAIVYLAVGCAAFIFFFVPDYSGAVFPYLAGAVGVLVVLGLINGTLFC